MDAYMIGFLGVTAFIFMVGLAALVLLSTETRMPGDADTRVRYTRVQQVDTNTLETVDLSGQVQRWQRSA